MSTTKQIPRWLVALVIALDAVLVVVLLGLLTWCTWHDGAMDKTPSEYRLLLTWLIYAVPLGAVTGAGAFAISYDMAEIRPREWEPDA